MLDNYSIHNLFWEDIDTFRKMDPHLSSLADLPYIHKSRLEVEIPICVPGIYILTGGRQVGKSTLVKMIIKKVLLEKKCLPHQIFYLPCDTILDFNGLLFEIEQFFKSIDLNRHFIIVLDEITYVKEWDRAIKSLADSGYFRKGSVLITGSDTVLLKEAMSKFPGRRGDADKHDFHLWPLSFFEYVILKDEVLYNKLKNYYLKFEQDFSILSKEISEDVFDGLKKYFFEYILTGGFMPSINSYAKHDLIKSVVYDIYLQWIIGDIIKKNKQESYLKQVISCLIPRFTKQITWHNISDNTTIGHHQTVADYIDLLVRMDVINILYAFDQNKKKMSIKKAKKINFNDPFIFHSLHKWIQDVENPFELSMELIEKKSDITNSLIEGTIASLFKRNWKNSYYVKSEGEVDIVLVKGNDFFPIEIKNVLVPRKKELKQILKYKKGLLAYSGYRITKYNDLDVVPIPLLAFLAG